MTRPANSQQMSFNMCMSPLAIEEAMDSSKSGDKQVERLFTYIKVGQPQLWMTAHICKSFGIPVRLVDDYESDEWSMVQIQIYRDGTVHIEETWSSGEGA